MDERSIAAVARVLARAEGADGEVTARHILTALTGLGWRRVIEPPPAPRAHPVDPVTNAALAAKARAAIRHTP